MPVPNIYEDTAATHGTGALSVPWGTHNDTFTAIILITSGGETIAQPTSADATWTLIAEAYEGTPGAAGSIGIAAYWARAVSGSMANVTVADSGDHTSAKMFMLQNVVASGNPINFADTQTVTPASASISFAAPSSTVANCLVFCFAGHAIDTGTPPGGSGWTNAGLDNIGFAGQYTTTNGVGGGYMGAAGEKASAGACGTFAHTWAGGATKQANLVFAISDTATVSDTGVGAADGTSTVAATGASVVAGAGSAAGTSTAEAVGASGNIGDAAGTSTASGAGAAIMASVGAAAGVGAAAASSTELRVVDVPSSLPGSVASGLWPLAVLDGGAYKWMWTPSLASTDASFDGFHAMISSGAASGYGFWLVSRALELYDTADNQIFTQPMTWSANAPITFIVDHRASPPTVTISGATTGNGTFTFTASAPYFEAGTLWIQQWTTGQFTLSGAIGDIYEITGAPEGAAAGTSSAAGVGVAIHAGAGAAAGTSSAAAVGTSGDGVRLGAYGSARQLFGAAATEVEVAINTQASGSTILVCVGGNLTDLATPPTDSEANTWTLVGTEQEFNDWPGYGIRVYSCVGATGATGHTFTQTMTLFDECTIAVLEVIEGVFLQDFAINQIDNGNPLVMGDVSITGPAYLVAFFSGDATTGQTTVISASNGYVVLDDSTFEDHPNGYVPIGILGRSATTAGDYGTTITETPDQGAIMANIAIQGSEVNASGSAAGTSTPAAVGSSIAAAEGASAGVASVAAAGTAIAAAEGDAAGTSDATAAGLAVSLAAGDAAGTSAAAATGAAAAAGAGAAAGTATAVAAGGSVAASSGAAAGTSDAAGVGQAAGDPADGASSGSSTAAGTGASVAAAAGASAGTSSVTAAGAAVAAGEGIAAGTSDASGVGVGAAPATGEAAGTSSAAATGGSVASAAGAAAGTSTAAGIGSSVTAAAGAAGGTSTASAIADGFEVRPLTAAIVAYAGETRITAYAGEARTGERMYRIVQGDTAPDMEILVTVDGVAEDISDATVMQLRMRAPDGTITLLDLTAVDLAAGTVKRVWEAEDTAQAGEHRGQVVLTRTGGVVQTFGGSVRNAHGIVSETAYLTWRVAAALE